MLITQSATTGIVSSLARGNQGNNLIDTGGVSAPSISSSASSSSSLVVSTALQGFVK